MKKNQEVAIIYREGKQTGVRYVSGRVIFDEQFKNCRLCTRYWSSSGQVWPEMYVEETGWDSNQPADTFTVGIDGRDLS